MEKSESARRDFIKLSAMGMGSLALKTGISHSFVTNDLSEQADQKKLNIICIGAHPGDPEFGCGGTMARYSDAGHRVIFLYLTRGEASNPSKSFAEMAALRTKEAEASCKILNAKPLFAGQIDGNTILDKEKSVELSNLILNERPDIVFSQWPVDSHPDHQVTGLLSLTAWINSGKKFHLYFYEVNTGSETMAFMPTDYVDITSVHEKKKAAMFAHKTQSPEETYNEFFRTMEEFRGLEAGVKLAEAFIHFNVAEDHTQIIGM